MITARALDRLGANSVIEKIRKRVGNANVYISVDIDVLDPAYAPGAFPVLGSITLGVEEQHYVEKTNPRWPTCSNGHRRARRLDNARTAHHPRRARRTQGCRRGRRRGGARLRQRRGDHRISGGPDRAVAAVLDGQSPVSIRIST